MNNQSNSLSLIASLYHATDILGLYRADLARILGLMCENVSTPNYLERLLSENAAYLQKAKRFVYFFELLDSRFPASEENMIHWFRKDNTALGTSPFLAMVDDNRLEDVIAELIT